MIDTNQIESLTKAYIVSYNTALKEVRNPDLAVQIAMSTTSIICMINNANNENKENKPKDPFSQLAMALAMHAAVQEHKENTEPDEEDDYAWGRCEG